jgi:hypothetical protein
MKLDEAVVLVKLSAGDLDSELWYPCKLFLKFGFYRSKTTLLRFSDQPINSSQKNDRPLFWELDDIHDRTVSKMQGLSILQLAVHIVNSVFQKNKS